MLKVIPGKEYINVAKEEPDIHLWHCRFGHLGMENMSKLINGKMVAGINDARDNGTNSACESCVMGKQHRTPYPKGIIPYRASEPFEIVHSDVCGPMHVNSFGNSRYFVTFIDDYSRFTHVYFIKTKDEVLEKFKEFVNYATNITGKKLESYVPITVVNIVRKPLKATCKRMELYIKPQSHIVLHKTE